MALNEQIGPLPSVDSVVSMGAVIISKIPEPPTPLSEREKVIWNHVTRALHEYQLIHLTDGLMLVVICKTYLAWVDANEQLEKYLQENDGNFIVETKNGYRTPHPVYYIEREKKRELLKWLPEAALTIPSFAKIKSSQLADSSQGNLFDDPLNDYKNSKPQIRLVRNAKG